MNAEMTDQMLQAMRQSNTEEIIGILWLILAVIVPYRWTRWLCCIFGGISLIASLTIAITRHTIP